jgi:hypothetical protein
MCGMGRTYAVSWKDTNGSTGAGRLELGPRSLRLLGPGTLEIPYDDVNAVAVGRGSGDRLHGRTTVVVSRPDGLQLWIAPVANDAVLLELHDRIGALARSAQ